MAKTAPIKPPLREIRQSKGLSQQQVSQLTNLPVTLISKHENGHSGISLATAMRYAKAYGMTLQELIGQDHPVFISQS